MASPLPAVAAVALPVAPVIALACMHLPPKQRLWGMVLGAGVAVVLRIAFTLVVAQAMGYPYLKIVGGLLLSRRLGRMRRELSQDEVGGGIMLGLRGVAVAAHGDATPAGIAVAGLCFACWDEKTPGEIEAAAGAVLRRNLNPHGKFFDDGVQR